jgi:hypothetical protein
MTEPLPEGWETPNTLTIPCPIELSRKRGVFSKKSEDFPSSIRLTPHDKELIEKEAKLIGVSFSTFVRWTAIQTARELAYIRTGTKPKADL